MKRLLGILVGLFIVWVGIVLCTNNTLTFYVSSPISITDDGHTTIVSCDYMNKNGTVVGHFKKLYLAEDKDNNKELQLLLDEHKIVKKDGFILFIGAIFVLLGLFVCSCTIGNYFCFKRMYKGKQLVSRSQFDDNWTCSDCVLGDMCYSQNYPVNNKIRQFFGYEALS